MNWRDRFEKLKSRADSAATLGDSGQRAELLRALTELNRELQADTRRLIASNSTTRMRTGQTEPRTGEAAALARMILLSQWDRSTLNDPSLQAFLETVGATCSEDRVALLTTCTAVFKRVVALGGMLGQLPLEDPAYVAELRSVMGLDEAARRQVHEQTEEIR